MDYDLESPVGPSSGRECLGPADMGIWVPKTTAFSLSATYISRLLQSVIYAQMILATCSSRDLVPTTKVFPKISVKPACQSVGLVSLFSFGFHHPDSMLTRLADEASLWPKLKGYNVRTTKCAPRPSPQASKPTCLPGEKQGWGWVEV